MFGNFFQILQVKKSSEKFSPDPDPTLANGHVKLLKKS